MKLGKINRQSIGISGFASVLKNYPGMPAELFIAGSLPDARVPSVAIIGSRKPTAYGEEVTYRLAYDLAKSGVVIISGLAYGIDIIAHQAALDAGGTTIAIMANGLHRIYPAAHRGVAQEIIKQGGAVISEQDMGIDAHKYHFLARNRIISGLADMVIVTEATEKSGTLSTVAHALEQNKDIGAVPGSISSLLSVGPNKLLQQGAHVILDAQDALRVIAPHLTPKQKRLPLGDTPLEVAILQLAQAGTQTIDEIVRAVESDPATTLQTITMMELKGTIRTFSGRIAIAV